MPGLPIVSIYTAFVLSSIAASNSSKLSGLTNLVSIPKRGNVAVNKLYVPPYNVEAATILSPALATFKMEYVIAAEPDATAIPPAPPSS